MIAQIGYSSGDTVANCLSLIERCAPRMMRVGGGYLSGECLASGNKIGARAKRAIVAARRRGESVEKIAQAAGVSTISVYKICRKAGIYRRRGAKVSPAVLARLLKLRGWGWPLARISKATGYSLDAVGLWLRRSKT